MEVHRLLNDFTDNVYILLSYLLDTNQASSWGKFLNRFLGKVFFSRHILLQSTIPTYIGFTFIASRIMLKLSSVVIQTSQHCVDMFFFNFKTNFSLFALEKKWVWESSKWQDYWTNPSISFFSSFFVQNYFLKWT